MMNIYFQGCQRSWDQQWCPEQWWTYIFRVARGPGTSTRPCSSPFSFRPSTCCTGSTSCQSPCTGPSGAITEISKWRKNPALYKMPQKEFSYFFYFHFIQLYKWCITNLNFWPCLRCRSQCWKIQYFCTKISTIPAVGTKDSQSCLIDLLVIPFLISI